MSQDNKIRHNRVHTTVFKYNKLISSEINKMNARPLCFLLTAFNGIMS